MRLKKLICIGLSLAVIASTAGCGGGSTGAASTEGSTAAEAEAATEQTPEGGAKEDAEAAEAEAEAEDAGSDTEGKDAGTGAEAAADTAGAEAPAADAAAGEEVSPDEISVTWEDSHLYDEMTLGRYYTIPTYGVKGYEEVPFIKVSDYMDYLLGGIQRISTKDGVMTIAVNGTEASIDPAADTLHFENSSLFRRSGSNKVGVVEETEFNFISWSVKNQSTQTDPKPVDISLKEYHMPVIAYEDDILMPFLALQNTFGTIAQSNVLAYNGRDYYDVLSAEVFIKDREDESLRQMPYLQAFYNGPFKEKKSTTQAYADYGYYSTCLLLDLTFGHKEEKNITTFDDYFTRMNAKGALCSTAPSAAMIAEVLLFNYLFDSGHDSIVGTYTAFGELELDNSAAVGEVADEIKESEEGKKLFEEAQQQEENVQDLTADAFLGALLEKGFKIPEVAPLYIWTYFFDSVRPEDYGHERLDYSGDTAVIYFDSFNDDTFRSPSYYMDPVREEDEAVSTFAFFHDCFEDIKEHEEVKNVVINLSDNGGGRACALVSVLGFLSEDGEVKMTLRDLVANNYREEYYHVDTNLDGIADDRDGYGGQYDFYIMCSGTSYSCANALPYYAQQSGLAKVIGCNPGGGDCVVASFADAYGRCAVYSGSLKLGREDENGVFVSDEKATTVDLNMMPSILDAADVPWFDADGIADAVHQYQNGATEITYNDKEDAEKVSDFLMGMFEKMMAGQEETESSETENTQE
ncbi:MAG: S41 family peptidase [Eubacteriales bacterium]|nr:S41 family peptidase [Eubacteriales bacterium]